MILSEDTVTLYTDTGEPVHMKLDAFIRGLLEYVVLLVPGQLSDTSNAGGDFKHGENKKES